LIVDPLLPNSPSANRIRLSEDEQAWLARKKTLRVAVKPNWGPIDVVQGDGLYTGMSGDYMQLVARRLGLGLEATQYLSQNDALQAMRTGSADILPALARTPEREMFIAFTQPYLDMPNGFFARRDLKPFALNSKLEGLRIVAEKGFAVVDQIKTQYPKAILVERGSTDEALSALAAGEADVYLGALATTTHRIQFMRLSNIEIRGELASPYRKLAFGVSQQIPDRVILQRLLNRAMSSITLDEARAIELRWLGTISGVRFAEGGLILSDAQREWLTRNSTIRVAYDPEMALISETNSAGSMRGAGVDFLSAAAAKLGLTIVESQQGDWAEVINMARQGKVDLLVAAAKTQERMPSFDFAGPYLTTRTVIADRFGGLPYTDLDDLNGKTLAVIKEHFLIPDIQRRHPGVRLQTHPTMRDVLDAVDAGKANAAIGNMYAVSQLVSTQFVGRLRISGHVNGGDSALYFATTADNPVLGQLMQVALSSLSTEERTEIRNKWLTVNYQTGVPLATILAYALPIGAALFFALGVFWYSNRRLQREVRAHEATTLELDQKRRIAEEASLSKARYLATMSHEIRNPMQGILAASEVLQKTVVDPSQRKMSYIIHEASSNLVQMLNEILDDARLGEGKMQVRPVCMSVRACAQSVADVFSVSAKAKGIETVVDVDGNVSAAHTLDGGLLRQVLSNLVSNAVKFTERGRVLVRVTATGIQNGSQNGAASGIQRLKIDIADTGPGMTIAETKRLFEPFLQGDASRTERIVGSGLGLSIAKRIVDAMGGSVFVTSEVGVGTTFSVVIDAPEANPAELPQRLFEPLAQPTVNASETAGLPAHERTTNGSAAMTSASALKVLLVEDDRLLQMLYVEQFDELGLDVTVMPDAESGFEAWQEGAFDVLVTDNNLDGMTGAAMVKMIRDEEARTGRARIPILGVSGSVLPVDRDRCLEAGMDEMVQKPIAGSDLHAKILALANRTAAA
jgi:two-component system, NarL family, sensor histidine kinase EvgS